MWGAIPLFVTWSSWMLHDRAQTTTLQDMTSCMFIYELSWHEHLWIYSICQIWEAFSHYFFKHFF